MDVPISNSLPVVATQIANGMTQQQKYVSSNRKKMKYTRYVKNDMHALNKTKRRLQNEKENNI